jgi:hypothetical protein
VLGTGKRTKRRSGRQGVVYLFIERRLVAQLRQDQGRDAAVARQIAGLREIPYYTKILSPLGALWRRERRPKQDRKTAAFGTAANPFQNLPARPVGELHVRED